MKKRNELSRLMLLVACALLLCVSCKPDDPEPEPDPKPTEKTYKVGDYYNVNGVKGIVFKISNGGKNGYIVSMNSVTLNDYPWALVKEAIGTDENDGEGNMNKIKIMTNWSTNYPAFKYWDDQGWHIPALNELKVIMNNLSSINSALKNNGGVEIGNGDYYTSSEESENNVYFASVNNDNINYFFSSKTLKLNTYYLKGIRKF